MKKIVCIVLAAVMAMALLTACAPQEAEEQTKLDAIQEAGVLVVGTSPDYPPYEFIVAGEDGSMETVGIDIWIAEDIAEALGVELKIEAMDFAGLDSALQMGTIDMIMAAYNPTEERAEIMDFSDVYYIDTVVAPDAGFRGRAVHLAGQLCGQDRGRAAGHHAGDGLLPAARGRGEDGAQEDHPARAGAQGGARWRPSSWRSRWPSRISRPIRS